MGRRQGGNPRERHDRSLQGDGEHHDDRDELALHIQKLSCPDTPKQIRRHFSKRDSQPHIDRPAHGRERWNHSGKARRVESRLPSAGEWIRVLPIEEIGDG